jgi:hypothetical protein
MAIQAPVSKYKRKNFLIYIAVCIIAAIIFAYDGYLSKYTWSRRHSFYQEHVIDNNNKPDGAMKFNRISPPIFIVAAVLLGGYLFTIKNKKIIADENDLIVNDKEKIPYDSIQKIDKTYFQKKGFFVITYKQSSGKEVHRKLNHRQYDNLAAILDHLVAKIT